MPRLAFSLILFVAAAWSPAVHANVARTPELNYLEKVVGLSGQGLSREAEGQRMKQARAEYQHDRASFEGSTPSSTTEIDRRLGEAAVTIGLVTADQSTQFVADAHRYQELMKLRPDGKVTKDERAELSRIRASYRSTGHAFSGSDFGVCLFGYGMVGLGLLIMDYTGSEELAAIPIILGAFGIYACHE